MNSLILRTIVPIIVCVMAIFSVYVLLRGHNEPGGGFIGGLIAACAIALYGMAHEPEKVRRALWVDPLALAGGGVVLAGMAGMLSWFYDVPFLTGLWTSVNLGEGGIDLSTPMVFDIGVYLVVFGTISAIALGLQEQGDEN